MTTSEPKKPKRMLFTEGGAFVHIDADGGRASLGELRGGSQGLKPCVVRVEHIDDLITLLCRARDYAASPAQYAQHGWRDVCADMIRDGRDVEAMRLLGQKSKAWSEYVGSLEEFYDAESADTNNVDRRTLAWKRVLELRARRAKRRRR